ncbi:MAG TPA: TetR/AcrR family transcriptional regulator [Gemmatimonadales bacterium]|nr:TetR/AcrR family transcriptional regulator [Gemmatimonadales bacterium]
MVDAATRLFLREGYGGTTMDAIAVEAGIVKRSLYNHYTDKNALFLEIVSGVTGFAEGFARGLRAELRAATAAADPAVMLHDIARRLAVAIVRPEVVALRRLLIGESRAFPDLARDYFDRAPGGVIAALASGFEHLTAVRVLRTRDPRRAASQFAYLVAGAPLDRAVLVGTVPPRAELAAGAREGVKTFLARYGAR